MKKIIFVLPLLVITSIPVFAESHSLNKNKKDNTEYSLKRNCKEYKKAKRMKHENQIKGIKSDLELIKNELKIT